MRLVVVIPWLMSCRDAVEPQVDRDGPPAATGTGAAAGTGADGTGSGTGTGTGDTPTTPTPQVSDVRVELLGESYTTVARVSWNQVGPGRMHLAFTFEDGVWHTSPTRALESGSHADLILGVPHDTLVTFGLVAEDGGIARTLFEGEVRTGPPEPEMPLATVVASDPTRWDDAMAYVFVAITEGPRMFGSRSWSVILDRRGRVVWAHRSPLQRVTTHPRVSWHGDALLVDHSSYFAALDEGRESEILSLKIDGSVAGRWPAPGHHHPYTDLPDGRLVYASYRTRPGELDPDDDVLVVIEPGTGARRDLVGCEALLRAQGHPHDWCGSNTVTYDEPRDALLFSLFTQEGIFQIDATSGVVTHVFGHIDGAWGFSPPDAAFWYQHGPVYTADGTLLVSSHLTGEIGPEPQDLVVREYRLDEDAEQLVEVWSFGEGQGVPGYQMGEAHRLPGGNTLHNYGTSSVLREVTPDERVVWDVRWETEQGPEDHQIGRSAPVLVDLYALAPELP